MVACGYMKKKWVSALGASSSADRAIDAVLDGLARAAPNRLEDQGHKLRLSCNDTNQDDGQRNNAPKGLIRFFKPFESIGFTGFVGYTGLRRLV